MIPLHASRFTVRARTIDDFEALRARGAFDGSGIDILFEEAANGTPERLRYGKLAMLLGIAFTPEQVKALEDRFKQDSKH